MLPAGQSTYSTYARHILIRQTPCGTLETSSSSKTQCWCLVCIECLHFERRNVISAEDSHITAHFPPPAGLSSFRYFYISATMSPKIAATFSPLLVLVSIHPHFWSLPSFWSSAAEMTPRSGLTSHLLPMIIIGTDSASLKSDQLIKIPMYLIYILGDREYFLE